MSDKPSPNQTLPLHGEPEWMAEAETRIDKHRKGAFSLQLQDETGKALAKQRATISLQRHDFHFGTCVKTKLLTEDSAYAGWYRDFLRQHFTALVDENTMKWYAVEKEDGLIDQAGGEELLRFCQDNDLKLRGHCLLWSKEKFNLEWVRQLDDQALRQRSLDHVARMAAKFPQLIAWDGINEMLDGRYFNDRLGDDFPRDVYQKAHEIAPKTPLFVNEYHVIDLDERCDKYLELIRSLLAQGTPIGGIGIQEHAVERMVPMAEATDRDNVERTSMHPLDPAAMWRRLDQMAEFNLPIHFTEISAKTPSIADRNEAIFRLLSVAFAHPRVEGFFLWGFSQPSHWLGGEGALIGNDNDARVAQRWMEAFSKRWTTEVKLESDADGWLHFEGFYGRYNLQITNGTTASVEFTPKGTLSKAIKLGAKAHSE